MPVMLGAVKHKITSSPVSTTVIPATIERRVSDNVIVSTFGGGNLSYTPSVEEIIYTTKLKSQRRQSNLCINTKTYTRWGGDVGGPRQNWISHDTYTTFNQVNLDAQGYHSVVIGLADTAFGVPHGTAQLGANCQGYINDAAWRLRPDLTTVSIPNDLLDWDQIPDLVKLWKQNLGLIKNVAGAHLNYSFGWKPTVGDIRDAINGVRTLKSKLDAFRKSVGKIISRSYTNLSDSTSKSGTYLPADVTRSVQWNASIDRKITSHVVYTPLFPTAFGQVDVQLRGMLDVLGFELNPRIIWDKIPFTFIIDWFIGIGAFLERFKVDTLELPIKYVDSFVQYKEDRKYHSNSLGVNTADKTWSSSALGTWDTHVEFFHRIPMFPDYATLSGLQWKPLNVNHAVLLLSLGVVNLG
jgi:hypothetical protein